MSKPTEFKYGDVRDDGFKFHAYGWYKKQNRWIEQWLSPKAWKRRVEGLTTPENKKKKAEYRKDKRATDLNYRLAETLRNRLYKAIKNGQKSGVAIENLGCSVKELKSLFTLFFREGMSWDNWGQVWQIDHIKTLSSFDLTDPNQVLEAAHYTNLQPLTCEENRKKGRKVINADH